MLALSKQCGGKKITLEIVLVLFLRLYNSSFRGGLLRGCFGFHLYQTYSNLFFVLFSVSNNFRLLVRGIDRNIVLLLLFVLDGE